MNHFTGEEDEVILLENVKVTTEPELTIGDAWCGYSKTLKKLSSKKGTKSNLMEKWSIKNTIKKYDIK